MVSAPTRCAVLDFVRENWGDDEATGGWFTEHVVNRIAYHGVRRFLTARYEVTDMTADEAARFAGALEAQAEGGEGDWDYPSARGTVDIQPPYPAEPRQVLVHLNVMVDPSDTRTNDEIREYLSDALGVGMEDHEGGRTLAVDIPLAEEVD